MKNLKIISFTHRTTDLAKIGKLHIDSQFRGDRLGEVLNQDVDELLYLSTCNRVELFIIDKYELTEDRLQTLFEAFNPMWNESEVSWAMENCSIYNGLEAVDHVFMTASSLDSLVIGEREIITQVRKSYDECNQLGLTGDYLRLIINKTIECAKEVYTKTNIAKNPVSVVSLAYRSLQNLSLAEDSRVLVVGAGETNTTMCRFLYKHGFKNFTIVNRTVERAEALATEVKGKALALDKLSTYQEGFDILVSCTGAEDPIFTAEVYEKVLQGEKDQKTVVDLALPVDVDPKIIEQFPVHYIEIGGLKKLSEKNLAERAKEIEKCKELISVHVSNFEGSFKERKVELVMREVPKKVKEIRQIATDEVFSKELDALDEESRVVVEKMMSYMEKKYISIPMKMAKEILLKNH